MNTNDDQSHNQIKDRVYTIRTLSMTTVVSAQ